MLHSATKITQCPRKTIGKFPQCCWMLSSEEKGALVLFFFLDVVGFVCHSRCVFLFQGALFEEIGVVSIQVLFVSSREKQSASLHNSSIEVVCMPALVPSLRDLVSCAFHGCCLCHSQRWCDVMDSTIKIVFFFLVICVVFCSHFAARVLGFLDPFSVNVRSAMNICNQESELSSFGFRQHRPAKSKSATLAIDVIWRTRVGWRFRWDVFLECAS